MRPSVAFNKIKNITSRYEQGFHEILKNDYVYAEEVKCIDNAIKALEIIKETPEFAWYVKIYENAYEMITDVKNFRINESAEELQKKFNLLKEVLYENNR